MHQRTTWIIGICGIMAALLSGCGGGISYDVAKVTGTVTSGGKAIPGGIILFTPIPAAGETELPPKPQGAVRQIIGRSLRGFGGSGFGA